MQAFAHLERRFNHPSRVFLGLLQLHFLTIGQSRKTILGLKTAFTVFLVFTDLVSVDIRKSLDKLCVPLRITLPQTQVVFDHRHVRIACCKALKFLTLAQKNLLLVFAPLFYALTLDLLQAAVNFASLLDQ